MRAWNASAGEHEPCARKSVVNSADGLSVLTVFAESLAPKFALKWHFIPKATVAFKS